MTDNSSSSANGPPTLKDRVKELQLGDQLGKGTGKGSSTTWLPWMLCILMAIAWGGFGIHYYRSGGAESGKGDPNAGKAKAVAPVIGAGEIVLESKGYLIPSHSIPISPIDVAGRVITLNIEEGKKFRKDDVLAVIDSTRYKAEVAEAKAQVEASKSRLAELTGALVYEKQQAEAELAEAKAQLAKDELEYQTAQSTLSGAVAKLEIGLLRKKMDATKEHLRVMEIKNELTKSASREQRITAAQHDKLAAEARLQRAQWSLDNCTIKAPVTGVILTKKAEEGSLINPVVGGVSTSLCEIADLRMLEVDLEIQERDIAKIDDDMLCEVRPDAYADKKYAGFVSRQMPIANRARGIVQVRVRVIVPFDEPQGRFLKPEMGVSVVFINSKIDPLVRIVAEIGAELGPFAKLAGDVGANIATASRKLTPK
jgi:HlyD family secretion protein